MLNVLIKYFRNERKLSLSFFFYPKKNHAYNDKQIKGGHTHVKFQKRC